MSLSIELLEAGDDIRRCASLMVVTSPWSDLHFSKEQCVTNLRDPEVVVHGAMSPRDGLIGFIASMASGIGKEPMIEYLCVAEEARGRGIGTDLIAFFEQVLFPDADNLYLFVSDINPRARRLYARLGYITAGALPDYNLESQTEFLLRKSRRPRQAGRVPDDLSGLCRPSAE
jgi:ribosomal protein S18 acetylase RimI-like enzyme